MIIVPSVVTEKLCDVFIADVLMQCHCALLLTMIFSTGESVPFTLYGKSTVCCPYYSASIIIKQVNLRENVY